MQKISILVAILALTSCAVENKDAQQIVDQAILKAGGDKYDNTEIEFLFRDREYGYKKTGGRYEYVRLFKDSTRVVRDVFDE